MLVLALLSVNATACAPTRVYPVREGRAWTEYLGTLTRAPSATESFPAAPRERWSADIGHAAIGSVALGDSVILVQAVDQTVSAVNRADGERRWKNRLDGPGAAGPILAWDVVYAATGGPDGKVYALALTDGHEHWSRTVGAVVGPMATGNQRVFVATERGIVNALDASNGGVHWRAALHGPVRSGVTIVNNQVVVGTDDSLFALSADSGRRLHVTAFPATVAPPAVSGDTLVFVTPDGDALAVNAADLSTLWRVTLSPSLANPAIAHDTLFVASLDGQLWRVPLANPTALTHAAVAGSLRAGPTPIEGGVLIGTVAGQIFRFSADSIPQWKDSVDGPIEQPVLVDKGSLIAVDGHGRIHLWH